MYISALYVLGVAIFTWNLVESAKILAELLD